MAFNLQLQPTPKRSPYVEQLLQPTQIQAFSKGPQIQEAILKALSQGLSGYMAGRERRKEQATQSDLAKMLVEASGAVPWIHPDTKQVAPGTRPLEVLTQRLTADPEGRFGDIASQIALQQLFAEPKKLTRGEVLSKVPTTELIQTGTRGPLRDPTKAFQPIIKERKRSPKEQFEADQAALRREGLLDESWYSPELVRELFKGDVAEDRFYRQEQFSNALQHGYKLKVMREGKLIEVDVGKIEAERADDLERKLYKWKAEIDTGKGPDIKTAFDLEQKIRKEYTAVAGDYRDRVGAFNLLMSTEDSPAGDIALVTNFMKMLDPGSVVREGEFDKAASAAGASERAVTALRGFVKGDVLGATQRADIRAVGMDIYKSTIEKFAPLEAQFRAIAKHYNLDADRILLNWADEPVTEEQRGKGATVEIGADIKVEDLEEGDFYTDQGRLYKKGETGPWWGVYQGKYYEGGVEVLPPKRNP